MIHNIFDIIDFNDGIIFPSDAKIFTNLSLEAQSFNLIEDIAQIYYEFNLGSKYIIDIGWKYEDFEVNSKNHFLVQIVKEDFSNLIFKKRCKSVDDLVLILKESIECVYLLEEE